MLRRGPTPDWQPGASKGRAQGGHRRPRRGAGRRRRAGHRVDGAVQQGRQDLMPDPIAQADGAELAAQKSVDPRRGRQPVRTSAAAGNAATTDATTPQHRPRRRPTAQAARRAGRPGAGPGRDPATPRRWPTPRSPTCPSTRRPRSRAPRVAPQPVRARRPSRRTPRAAAPQADVQAPAMQQTPDTPTVTPSAPGPAPDTEPPAPTRPRPSKAVTVTPASASWPVRLPESHHDAALPLVARPALAGPCARQPGDDARAGRHRRLLAFRRVALARCRRLRSVGRAPRESRSRHGFWRAARARLPDRHRADGRGARRWSHRWWTCPRRRRRPSASETRRLLHRRRIPKTALRAVSFVSTSWGLR